MKYTIQSSEVLVTIASVILAAGFGSRMKSTLPKVLHRIAGRPMVAWPLRSVSQVSDLLPVLVVGHGREAVESEIGEQAQYVEQTELLGTGHALLTAAPLLGGKSELVLVCYGDMPLLQAATLQTLVQTFQVQKSSGDLALAMLTVRRADSQGFGRVVRDEQGRVQAIVEEVDCTPEQRLIQELNPGIYCFDAEWLWANLAQIPLSAKGEYYLTDMVAIAVGQGRRVVTVEAPADDVYGINTRVQLAQAAAVMRQRIAERHMLNGVTLIDPQTTYIDDTVEIGQDTVILPGTILEGKTKIGCHASIGPHSHVIDSIVADYGRVTYSVIEQARLDEYAEIGPFGRLRAGAHLGPGVHMGSFGEVKNSYLGAGVKMGHFSYLGDAQVGDETIIAAGTITCNFDGVQKNRTEIGDHVFIGSDTLLVAPVTIGDGAQTGAGSVVTQNIPARALAYGVPARVRGTAKTQLDE